jgi:hypothetical protein
MHEVGCVWPNVFLRQHQRLAIQLDTYFRIWWETRPWDGPNWDMRRWGHILWYAVQITACVRIEVIMYCLFFSEIFLLTLTFLSSPIILLRDISLYKIQINTPHFTKCWIYTKTRSRADRDAAGVCDWMRSFLAQQYGTKQNEIFSFIIVIIITYICVTWTIIFSNAKPKTYRLERLAHCVLRVPVVKSVS